MPLIEQEAANFARKVQAIKNATIDHVYNLGSNMSRQELVVLIDQIDFVALVNNLGYEKATNQLVDTYTKVLQGIELSPGAVVSEEVLQALVNTDRTFYAAKGSDLANTIKQELTQGVLGGASRSTMKAAIADLSTFTDAQVRTLVDTSMRVFSREVNAVMADALPNDTKYIYFGPVDDKTRDVCVEMAAAGPLTQAEIESQFPGSFITGGGFNCRHTWRIDTSQSSKLSGEDKAQAKIDKDPSILGAGTPLENAT